ncbi:hypothetical protein FE275_19430 [Pseudomonas koreensis]|uniref:hypothetical protein n=1 Tax=Pseudomonas koreensis TaxID=198620 RepID=UPI00123A5702|nr:hypothetical protein [Pseudomonas koreensis]KAA8739139.1 hypothetical protein FE275_19430 [Pseudomonas koreensis]
MRFRDWFVPDEIQSAAQAAAQMFHVAANTSHFWLKQLTGSLFPIVLGGGIGWWAVINNADLKSVESLKDVVTNVLTFASVLAGFMVTLMLFTGRTSGTKLLTVDQAPEYVQKVTYLLFSQAFTLIIHIGCIVLCVAWLFMLGVKSSPAVGLWLLVAVFGVVSLSLFRTVLLPFQIYEVHLFELEAMLEEKYREYEESKGGDDE